MVLYISEPANQACVSPLLSKRSHMGFSLAYVPPVYGGLCQAC
jgi:hypothetical protein